MEVVTFCIFYLIGLIFVKFINKINSQVNNHSNYKKGIILLVMFSTSTQILIIFCLLVPSLSLPNNIAVYILISIIGIVFSLYTYYEYKNTIAEDYEELKIPDRNQKNHLDIITNYGDGIIKEKDFLCSVEAIKEDEYKALKNISASELRKIIKNCNLIISQITSKDVEFLVAIISAVYIPYILENIFNMIQVTDKNIFIYKVIIYGLLLLGITKIYFGRIKSDSNRNKNLTELIYYCEEVLIKIKETS
ncbi:hypothetical protein LMF32_12300 [Desemzia sp. C1]|uniref:hypothetical protein n=1 Tax=Desemzia sp. C1 TaxID=2892016 RepID=UPI001E3052E9|nr:hypothetical protein [Desemzia sp. C1]MCI3029825.1 hypothetical protein [Desemzia sp. C1]